MPQRLMQTCDPLSDAGGLIFQAMNYAISGDAGKTSLCVEYALGKLEEVKKTLKDQPKAPDENIIRIAS